MQQLTTESAFPSTGTNLDLPQVEKWLLKGYSGFMVYVTEPDYPTGSLQIFFSFFTTTSHAQAIKQAKKYIDCTRKANFSAKLHVIEDTWE